MTIQANKLTIPRSGEIRQEAISLLVNELGIAKASLYFRDNSTSQTDYLKTKQVLFQNKTTIECYEEIKTFISQ